MGGCCNDCVCVFLQGGCARTRVESHPAEHFEVGELGKLPNCYGWARAAKSYGACSLEA